MADEDVNNDDAFYRQLSDVKAYLIETVDGNIKTTLIDSEKINVQDKLAGITGNKGHKVVFNTLQTDFTLVGHAFDEIQVINANTKDEYTVGWNGNDFIIEITQVSDKTLIKNLSDVKAYVFDLNYQLSAIADADINVAELLAEVSDENGQTVTFDAKDSLYNKVARVFDIINPENKESINARNFRLALKDVSVENYFAKSKVSAYDVSDVTNVKPLPKEDISLVSDLASAKGIYDTTLETKKGTSITVKSEIYDNGGITEDGLEELYANNFRINVLDLSEENIKEMSSLVAINIENDDEVIIDNAEMTIVSEIPTEVGKYTVTFRSPKNNEISVEMTVVGNLSIQANDIEMTKEAYEKMHKEETLEDFIVNESNAKVLVQENSQTLDGVKVRANQVDEIIVNYGEDYVIDLEFDLKDNNIHEKVDTDLLTTQINLSIKDAEKPVVIPPEVEKPTTPTKPETGVINNEAAYAYLLLVGALLLVVSKKEKKLLSNDLNIYK